MSYAVVVFVNGRVMWSRTVPESQLVSVCRELSRDYPNGFIQATLQR